MNKLIVNVSLIAASVIVLLAGPALVLAAGNGSSEGRRSADPTPHRIGLIDMARVFKQYKKFEALREELKGDLTKSEEKFKAMAQQIQKEQKELTTFKEGTEEYSKAEKALLNHTTMAETFRKSQQRDLIRREAAIYKQVYLEVADAVQRYASFYHYTLVLRFSSDEVSGTENAEDVMRGLNRQVVYYRPDDDLTNHIVGYLNKQYETTATHTDSKAPARQ